MNADHDGRTNIADGVTGIQANGDVYDSIVYIVQPEDPPQRRYEVGVNHLTGGSPARAKELISDAIAQGYDNSEVRFHLVLALLSKRAYRDLSAQDREQLSRNKELLGAIADDKWKRALEVIYELLACQRERSGDTSSVLGRLQELEDGPRRQIIHHLSHVLTGSVKDHLWDETRRAAETTQSGNERQDRVWAYFEPKPISARACKPAPDRTTYLDRVLATIWSALAVASVGYLGWLAFIHAAPLPLFVLPLALAASYVGARTGFEWRYRRRRLRIKDREYLGQPGVNRAPEGGFASGVDRRFEHYFSKYVPRGISREDWLVETAGIKQSLRDEIVELYRERRVPVGRVNWLIRYLAADVRSRRENGSLWQYRELHKTTPGTMLWCSVSIAVLLAATLLLVTTAARAALLPSLVAIAFLVLSGYKAATRWLGIFGERRRLHEEKREYKRQLREREAEYRRWRAKLDSIRPSEDAMETWLSADVTLLLDHALKLYRLAWRDVLAHAVLLTPARGCQRARATGGLWRYSEYEGRLFLITQDGVRELIARLNFRKPEFEIRARNNYRFDAVSSVYVERSGQYGHELRLTLTNGPSHEIEVTGVEVPEAESEENPDMFARVNLDAAGFHHTLRILEGIAAEGKGWVERDRAGERLQEPTQPDGARR